MNTTKNKIIKGEQYRSRKGSFLFSTLRTSLANVACVALLAGLVSACANDSTAIDSAVNDGRILAAQIAGVSVQGASTDGVAATSVATRAATAPQPNKVITDFSEGDVFDLDYSNDLEGDVTAYVKKQADGSWNTYSNYEGTTPHTVYLDANNEFTHGAFYPGFTGDVPAGQTPLKVRHIDTEINVSGCYSTATPSGSSHGTLVCYDALYNGGSKEIVTTGNKRTYKLTYAFTHTNYLLTLNVAKSANSTLAGVASVTCTVRATNSSGVFEYYDVEATSTGAATTTDGLSTPQWRVILPQNSGIINFRLTCIKVKGQLADGSEWSYTADLEKAGTGFATTSGHSRTATLTVDEHSTLTFNPVVDSWTTVDSGTATVTNPGIHTAADLVAFRDEWNAKGAAGSYSSWTLSGGAPTATNPIVLANDIDLKSVCSQSLAKSWGPIGTSAKPFTGGFNGLGHTIKNLYINQTVFYNYGLFGYTGTSAYIENVTLDKPVVKALAGYIGALIGSMSEGKAIGCTVSDPTIALQSDVFAGYTGGIVGANNGGCVAVCRVIGTASITGVSVTEFGTGSIVGIVGLNGGTGYVLACYANVSTLTGVSGYVGSIVGSNNGNVHTCTGNSSTLPAVGTGGTVTNATNITGADFNSVVGTYSTSYSAWADANTLNAAIGMWNVSNKANPIRYIFEQRADGLPRAVKNYDLQITY